MLYALLYVKLVKNHDRHPESIELLLPSFATNISRASKLSKIPIVRHYKSMTISQIQHVQRLAIASGSMYINTLWQLKTSLAIPVEVQDLMDATVNGQNKPYTAKCTRFWICPRRCIKHSVSATDEGYIAQAQPDK